MNIEEKLQLAREKHQEMARIVDLCKKYKGGTDLWSVMWDDFWSVRAGFPFVVEWSDWESGNKQEIMAYFTAVDDFMKGFDFYGEMDQ